MPRINEHYLHLRAAYLFAEIRRGTDAFAAAHPEARLVDLGVGDVTRPLPHSVVRALHEAADDMAHAETFKGYGPYAGYEWLRAAIARHDFAPRGVRLEVDEIFVSDGGKSDSANLQELFATECAVAVMDPVWRSFSKSAGFTGMRLAYTVVPREAKGRTAGGETVGLNALWARRIGMKSNGAPYVIQKAAAAVYTPEGDKEIRALIEFYLGNARIIRDGLAAAGLTAYGGDNAPYVWFRTPAGVSSWDFFDRLLTTAGVVGAPGSGFGPSGEGCFRLTGFGSREQTEEAVTRLRTRL